MTKRLTQAQKVTNVLNAMGKTKAQVAETLRKAKVKGERGAGTSCPVAKYVKRRVRGCGTSHRGLYIDDSYVQFPGEWRDWVPVPRAVGDFIRAFDENEYPELES